MTKIVGCLLPFSLILYYASLNSKIIVLKINSLILEKSFFHRYMAGFNHFLICKEQNS